MSDPILSASDAEAVTAGVREAAPAKINLALHVTGQRADGYHLLDSLVVFADVGDRVWVQPAARMALRVGGPMAAGVPDDGRNLCWKAAEAFGRNVAITLDKHLPAAAGIGGGSADAAAVLRAMGRLFPEAEPVEALPLGADVPVCLAGQSARMQGIGETVHPVTLPVLHAVLVNPGVAVSTPQVFARLSSKTNPALSALPQACGAAALCDWLQKQRNDLQAPAIAQQPVIGTVLAALAAQPAARLARMSGSGATCFGLFADALGAEAAARRLQAAHPGWWVRACVLGQAMRATT